VTKDTKQKPDAAAADAAKSGQAPAGADAAAAGKKKGIMPMLMLGGGGLLLLAIVVAGTLYVTVDSTSAKTAAKPDEKGSPKEKTDSTLAAGESKPTESHGTEVAEKNPDSADFIPATVDTAAAMAALSKSIQIMDEANKAAQDEELKSNPEDSIKEAAWIAKARETITQKENALSAREAALNKKEQQITAKLMKLEQATSDRVTNLAKLYDGMEGAAVAKLMANLEDSIVVSLIPRMKQKNASDVLTLLPPVRAAAISRQILTIADEK
jgi:flagellar motility protein MotE (MotC chaperone)